MIRRLLPIALLFSTKIAFAQDPAVAPNATPSPAPTLSPAPAPTTTTPPSTAVVNLDAPPSYEGTIAPPTAAASKPHGDGIQAGLEVFAEYKLTVTRSQTGSSDWFHEFDLPRAHGAIDGRYKDVGGRIVLEAVRSASEGALIGVSGNSLVLRIREAYGSWNPIEAVKLQAGVIPTLTIPEFDGTWMLRAIAPSTIESAGLEAAADLGASASWDLPKKYGRIAIAGYNGEGYASPELNRGKNVEAAAEIHPVPTGAMLPFGVFVSGESGSTGTELARANRASGGLVWQGAKLRAGILGTYAWGVEDVGAQRAVLADAFVRVEPIDRVLLGARFSYLVRDVGANPPDALSSFWATVGYRVRDPLEAFVAFTRSVPTARAESELPGTNEWDLRAIVRVVF
ncbi:MAG TPA: hypothetical protein VF407_19425 [Polyangiaceae bacterium]